MICETTPKAGRMMMYEMIDELSRDAVAKDLVTKMMNKAPGNDEGGNN